MDKDKYVTEAEAIELTGYARTSLWQFRTNGVLTWTASITGRKIRYLLSDLHKLMGL